MKKIFISMFIPLAIIFCVAYVTWSEFKKELVQIEAENAKEQEELKKQNEEREKEKLRRQEKKAELHEDSKYLTMITFAQHKYHNAEGTYTNDFSKLKFDLDNKDDIISKGTSSFTTDKGIVYSIANEEKVIAIKPQEYSLELLYKTGELICRDNGSGDCAAMGMISKSALEPITLSPEENIKEAKKKIKEEQEEYISQWEEKWKKQEEELAKIQLSSIKENELTEEKKLDILEKNKKLFKNTKLLSLIADCQRKYHSKNGRYALDFNELNFNLDNIDGVVSKERFRFTTEEGVIYTMDSTRITAIATKSKFYFLEKYYNGTTNCKDNGNGSCAEMGLRSMPMSEYKNYIGKDENTKVNKTSKVQVCTKKPLEEVRKENSERMSKFIKHPASRILGLISNAQHNYHITHGAYTDDLNKLNINFDEIEGIVSRKTSSFTTQDGITYYIDKEKAWATTPQEYVIETSYKTHRITCEDNGSGGCETVGMQSKSAIHTGYSNNK